MATPSPTQTGKAQAESHALTLQKLAKRALTHWQQGTTDQAPDVMALPVAGYTDTHQYDHEVRQLFHRGPICVALSLELPAAGSYVAREVMGVPVLLTRSDDGTARGFINVCRHRGAKLCADGDGKRTEFSCPYHAWRYSNRGELLAIYDEDKFGALNKQARGLTPLHCSERAGLIFICLDPTVTADIDQWQGSMQAQLETLELNNWVLFEQRDLPGPGWKVTLDGYLEVYHHNVVHRSTVGRHTIGNLLVHDTFGPHQRLTFGRHTLPELGNLPIDKWQQPADHIRLIHSVFPNLSVSGIVGGHCLVSQIFPGETPDTTITRQSILCAKESGKDNAAPSAQWREAAELFSEMTLQAVQDEDYAIGQRVQDALHSNANSEFVIGRNEPAVQHYHQQVGQLAYAKPERRKDWGLG